ncbi:MAG: molybdopterin-dependent oxidoreductase [Acidimicrobiales bacterium]|nr:molybdopterin-dependent oxidoreductase [Acidimicrobiales bacterium]
MTTTPFPTSTNHPVRHPPSWWAGAIAGMAAGGTALAVGELAGALAAPKPGPVIAVSNRVIEHAPVWFVNFGKQVFGLADKPALIAGTLILSILFAAGLGVISLRSRVVGVAGIAAFGVLGLIAMGVDPQGGWVYAAAVSLAAVVAGVVSLLALLRRVPRNEVPDLENPISARPVERRTFLGWAAAMAAAIGAVAVGANQLRGRAAVESARDEVELPTEVGEAEIQAQVSAAVASEVANTPGIADLITPNDEFYLIDTATLVPQVDPSSWELTIKGMVDREVTYTYDDLLARASTIAPVTLSCVSNEVGGQLVGNAVWQGVPLSELLDEAGVQTGATQIRSQSVDGWDCGFPTDAAFDGRTALVAIAMNGEPLPVDHGFPARLVVSGLYGYVSATKWLKEIELTTWEAFDGFWIPRGWSKSGPIKTQSRIDTPRNGETISSSGAAVPIAGVAWAPNLGIERVEVQIDDGDWFEATLGESLGDDSWLQWSLAWTPTPGQHRIRVRATDGTGETQTSEVARPAPNGASGWHTITVKA